MTAADLLMHELRRHGSRQRRSTCGSGSDDQLLGERTSAFGWRPRLWESIVHLPQDRQDLFLRP